MHSQAPYNEQEILTRLINKEKEAFDYVYHCFYERLFFYARKMVVPETAEEILSETFLKLWRRNDRFNSLAEVEQWLRVALRNGCIDHLRKESKAEDLAAAFQYLYGQQYEDGYFRSSVEAELFGRILNEIDKLPRLTATILKLSFLQGLRVDEIAARLNISRQVVYNKKSLGIKSLRVALSDKELALVLLLAVPMINVHYSA